MASKPRCKKCNLVIGSQWQQWCGVEDCPARCTQLSQKRARSTRKRVKA